MKTMEEKLKIIHDFEKTMNDLATQSETALAHFNLKAIINTAAAVNNENAKIVNMYLGEIREAINPMSDYSIPAVIAVLKTYTDVLEKKYPKARGMADEIQKNLKYSAISTEIRGGDMKNEK